MIAALFFAAMPLATTKVALGQGPADYLAYDAEYHRVWAPGGDGVALIGDDGQVTHITGFATAERRGSRGKMRKLGPSSGR